MYAYMDMCTVHVMHPGTCMSRQGVGFRRLPLSNFIGAGILWRVKGAKKEKKKKESYMK